MADLRTNILDASGPLLQASWGMGFGSVVPGYTTYGPNVIERKHRTVKGLLPGKYNARDAATLMKDVCSAVDSRVRSKKYDGIVHQIAGPPAALYRWPSTKTSSRGDDNDDPTELDATQSARLDVERLLAHYNTFGAEKINTALLSAALAPVTPARDLDVLTSVGSQTVGS